VYLVLGAHLLAGYLRVQVVEAKLGAALAAAVEPGTDSDAGSGDRRPREWSTLPYLGRHLGNLARYLTYLRYLVSSMLSQLTRTGILHPPSSILNGTRTRTVGSSEPPTVPIQVLHTCSRHSWEHAAKNDPGTSCLIRACLSADSP